MALWSAFHGRVLPDVIGCPLPLLDQKLIETARDFCTRSKSWRHQQTFTVATGQKVFTLTPPTGTEAVALLSAKADDEDITVKTKSGLPPDFAVVEAGEFEGAALLTPLTFTVAPWLQAGAKLYVVAAIRPTHDATGVDDAVWAEHVEAIAWGAKYRLWSQPRQDWTEPNLASLARAEYEDRVHHAANIDWRENGERRTKSWG